MIHVKRLIERNDYHELWRYERIFAYELQEFLRSWRQHPRAEVYWRRLGTDEPWQKASLL
jgi:hypothetical protein